MGSSSWFHPIQDLPWTLHIFEHKLQLLEEDVRGSSSSSSDSSYCWVLFLFQHISRSKIPPQTIFLDFFFFFLSFFPLLLWTLFWTALIVVKKPGLANDPPGLNSQTLCLCAPHPPSLAPPSWCALSTKLEEETVWHDQGYVRCI